MAMTLACPVRSEVSITSRSATFGRLTQLVRVSVLHAESHWFESNIVYHFMLAIA